MENIFLGPLFVEITFILFSLLTKNYKYLLFAIILTLITLFLYLISGGYKRIKIFLKAQKLLKKFPKNSNSIGLKQVSEILNIDIEYLKNLNISFSGPNIQPKAYTKSISLKDKDSLSKYEFKQLVYFILSDIELIDSKPTKIDFLER